MLLDKLFFLLILFRGGVRSKVIFMTRGGGGVRQKVIFNDKGGRGVSQIVIFDDEGGRGGPDPPPKKDDIIYEQPLSDLECSCYRPVNLLLGKIVEKAIFNQLVKYLEDNRLLNPNHHGGRKGHSTTTALLQMYNTWMEQLEEGHLVGIMMIDQSAAFDLCDHKLLIEKMKLLGVEETSASWLESYLKNRSQSTLVDGYLSESIPLPPCSVIQGGTGSGLLYLVYTNNLPDTIHSHKVEF